MASLKTFRYDDAGKMLEHTSRKHPQTRDEHIDTLRSYTNRQLSPNRGMDDTAYLEKRISEVSHVNRKSLKVMGSWVVTVPKDLLYEKTELVDTFFDKVYDFMTGRYGEINTVSSWVHYDEAVPHMHYNFVPVVYDGELKQERINASKCIPYGSLGAFHWEMKDYLDEYFGFSVNVAVNAVRGEGDLSVLQLKVRTLTEEIEKLENKRDELLLALDVNEDISGLKTAETEEGILLKREDYEKLKNSAAAYELYRPLLSEISEREKASRELTATGMKDLSLAYELFGLSQRRLFGELDRRESEQQSREVLLNELRRSAASEEKFLSDIRSSLTVSGDGPLSDKLEVLTDILAERNNELLDALERTENLTEKMLEEQRESLLSSFDERYSMLLRENSSLRKQNDILMELRSLLMASDEGTGGIQRHLGAGAEELEELLKEEKEEYISSFKAEEFRKETETLRIK